MTSLPHLSGDDRDAGSAGTYWKADASQGGYAYALHQLYGRGFVEVLNPRAHDGRYVMELLKPFEGDTREYVDRAMHILDTGPHTAIAPFSVARYNRWRGQFDAYLLEMDLRYTSPGGALHGYGVLLNLAGNLPDVFAGADTCLIHGDPTRSNMMQRPGTHEPVFIDPLSPKAYVYANKQYDYGKIWQSVLGWDCEYTQKDFDFAKQRVPFEPAVIAHVMIRIVPYLANGTLTIEERWRTVVHRFLDTCGAAR